MVISSRWQDCFSQPHVIVALKKKSAPREGVSSGNTAAFCWYFQTVMSLGLFNELKVWTRPSPLKFTHILCVLFWCYFCHFVLKNICFPPVDWKGGSCWNIVACAAARCHHLFPLAVSIAIIHIYFWLTRQLFYHPKAEKRYFFYLVKFQDGFSFSLNIDFHQAIQTQTEICNKTAGWHPVYYWFYVDMLFIFFWACLYLNVRTRWLLYLILSIFRLPFPNSQPTNDLSESSNIKLETLLCRPAVTVTFLPTGQLNRDAHSQSGIIHTQSIHFLFFWDDSHLVPTYCFMFHVGCL